MEASEKDYLEETIKKFLIVGETLDGWHSFYEKSYRNLLIAILLFFSFIFSIFQLFSQGASWVILSLSFILGTSYFLLKFRLKTTYVITKFRVIRIVEGDLITRKIFQSSELVGFTDLHYEHVESINIGTPSISMPRLYGSVILITVGLTLVDLFSITSLQVGLTELVGIFLFLSGSVNILFSLPMGGVRLVVQSISGDTMEFPESQTPSKFVDDLILNCRTFLSYGAR